MNVPGQIQMFLPRPFGILRNGSMKKTRLGVFDFGNPRKFARSSKWICNPVFALLDGVSGFRGRRGSSGKRAHLGGWALYPQ